MSETEKKGSCDHLWGVRNRVEMRYSAYVGEGGAAGPYVWVTTYFCQKCLAEKRVRD